MTTSTTPNNFTPLAGGTSRAVPEAGEGVSLSEIVTTLNAKPTAGGFIACCPAHEDRTPSLSIAEGHDGRILMKCFAGCTTEAVCAAMGLRMADLMPAANGSFRPRRMPRSASQVAPRVKTTTAKPRRFWASVEDAAKAITPSGFDLVEVYHYQRVECVPFAAVARYEKPDHDKTFRQFHITAQGWSDCAPDGLWPIYLGLGVGPDPVFVVEGEKSCHAALGFGINAVCSSGGSNGAHKTDWSSLGGRQVIILPDNDDAGRKYADQVRAILLGLGCRVAIYAIPNLPEGGDIADLHDLEGVLS